MRAHLALALVAVIWGSAYLFTKIALRDMGPFELALARMLVASALVLPAFLRTRHELRVRDGLLLGLLGVAIYYGAFNVALRDARAVDAGVIQAAIPVASALIAIPALGERGTSRTWTGIALSTAGVLVLVSGTTAQGEGSLAGDLWMLVTVVDWALYNVVVRRLSRRASDTATASAALVWGTLLVAPLAAVEFATVRPVLTPEGIGAVLFLGAAASALGYWLWSYGLARVEAGRASTYLNLLPLVAAFTGVLVLGEHVGAVELAGGALVLAGVALAQRR